MAAVLALVSCAGQREVAFEKEKQQCEATIPKIIGNYARRQQCIVDAARKAGFHGAAEELLFATRIELAEKVDKGEMTPTEASARYASVRYQVQREMDADRAQRAQAAAAIMRATPQPQPYVLPTPYQIPVAQPWHATCSTIGGITNCNGY